MEDPTQKEVKQQRRISLADQLQDMLLQAYKDRLESGNLSDTGLGQLQKLLMANGMDLDPNSIKKTLGDHLTTRLDPDELEDDDPDVLDIRSRRGA